MNSCEGIRTPRLQTTGSITNAISANYFQKKLVLVKEQRVRLESLGLLEAYVQNHIETFFQSWYRPRLEMVSLDERAEAEATLSRIMDMYGRIDLMSELRTTSEAQS